MHAAEQVRGRKPSVGAQARRWLSACLDLAFPRACVCCHVGLEDPQSSLLCRHCRDALLDRRAACTRCGLVAPPSAGAPGCVQCRQQRFHFERVVRLGTYDDLLRQCVLQMKSARHLAQSMALGDWLSESRESQLRGWPADAVVAVPMHWTRRLRRGTNSSEVVAARLARRLNLPAASHVLRRIRPTRPQARLSPRKRLANVRGAFGVRWSRDLAGARIWLVDDVMTTGATANEAARALRKAGVAAVSIVVLARAAGAP